MQQTHFNYLKKEERETRTEAKDLIESRAANMWVEASSGFAPIVRSFTCTGNISAEMK
jgi:hypothetical protein